MSPRRFTSPFYLFSLLVLAVLFAFFAHSANAAPAPNPLPEPTSPTVGEVIGNNRNMACFAGSCYYKANGTEIITGSIAAESAKPTDSVSAPAALVQNSAIQHYDVRLIWPIVIAGTSLLFVL